MWPRIFILAIVCVSFRGSDALGDSNYPLFSSDDGLSSSKVNEKLTEILALCEQQLKRIDAVDYK